MKITRLIREYVTEEVHKAFSAKENPYAEQAKADEENIRQFRKQLKEQQETAIEHFVRNNNIYRSWSGGPYGVCISIPSFHDMTTSAMRKAKEWEEESLRQEAQKIRDILVSLELGATKAELKAMIEELMSE